MRLSEWLDELDAASDMHVPCGACTACCTSSQFVHIEPDETDTLAHVPAVLRFPAPGLPKGHVVMGYDERGHCPMLVDGACSIYEHRPRTCRTYDCRIFAVTGVEPDQPAIAARGGATGASTSTTARPGMPCGRRCRQTGHRSRGRCAALSSARRREST